jgi:hypothetical protein
LEPEYVPLSVFQTGGHGGCWSQKPAWIAQNDTEQPVVPVGNNYDLRNNASMRYILKQIVGVFGLIGILALPTQVKAATLVMNATEDTFLGGRAGFFAGNNYGGDVAVYLGNSVTYSPLLRFDVSGLSSLTGATINSVTLNLTASVTMTSSSTLWIFQVAAANSGWVEGTGTLGSPNTTLGASGTFANISGSAAWAAGGNWGDDWMATMKAGNVSGSAVYTGALTTTVNTAKNLVLSNSLISGWLSNGALASAGIVLDTTTGGNPLSGGQAGQFQYGFHSSEASNSTFRPTITVDYTAVPEPTSMALVGAGLASLMVFRLRRKSSDLI